MMVRWVPRAEPPPAVSGAEIRAFRDRVGWTQQELALALGCDHSTIWRWESGDRNPQGTVALALAYLECAIGRSRPAADRDEGSDG